MMEYFNFKKVNKHPADAEKSEAPVLNEEDEAFLHRLASEGTPPPLPERPQDLPVAGEPSNKDAQVALLDGAQNIPLPDVPDTPDGVVPAVEAESSKTGGSKTVKHSRLPFKWSFLRRDSRDSKRRDREVVATDLSSVAEGLKSADAKPNEDGNVSDHEAKKEEDEMTSVLEKLNLAAINNRVFSLSDESRELLTKFNLVFKDLINGVPTAYGDLESLLTNSNHQLERTYTHLPSFLQKLIEQLPSKMTESITPEMLAAAAERQGLHSQYTDRAASTAGKMGMKVKVPTLKELVTKPGAVAAMLRSITNFLKFRFPAFLGMNVLYSLALFLLLLMFWYCHKRGREVRLEKERLMTESEIAALNEEEVSLPSSRTTTTAPEGAPIEEVRAGMHDDVLEGSAPYAEEGSLGKELAKKKEEHEKLAKEKDEQEKSARENDEQKKQAKENDEQEKPARENDQQEKPAKENDEPKKLAKEKDEQEKLAGEKDEHEKRAKVETDAVKT